RDRRRWRPRQTKGVSPRGRLQCGIMNGQWLLVEQMLQFLELHSGKTVTVGLQFGAISIEAACPVFLIDQAGRQSLDRAKFAEARQVVLERDGQVPPPTDCQLGLDQFEQKAAPKRVLDRRQEAPQINEVTVSLAPGSLQRLALLVQAAPIVIR